MAPTTDVADQYFTYESRLSSFQITQQLSKRRASNASSKAPKTLKWPHKFLSGEELARAGFFYYPIQNNPDNVACFLCRKSLDGWEKDDDPLVEHLKHSPDCGWAIVATIEKQNGELSQEYPLSPPMIEARKATFADKWPHESKKGWKCKVKQMVDAGWKYTPTPEYDDMATCTYCSLALDGWEPSDKPMDEHFKRSPECSFFALINNQKQSPATKRTKSKKDRTSKVSRLSTQSQFTVASEAPSFADIPTEEGDSILTTATTATQSGRKMGKGKKAAAGKGRKTKAKKSEAVEVPAPEPKDDDFEVKIEAAPKPARGRKRKTEESVESTVLEAEIPAPKRRATRSRASVVTDDTILTPNEKNALEITSKPTAPGRKKGRQSARKASAASVASFGALVPNDDEIDAALEADLNRHLTDDEEKPIATKESSWSSKIAKAGHDMFGTEPMKIDDAAIDAELQAMEVESILQPKPKGPKGKQPRKVSAKQQAAAKKAAEAEAAARQAAEEEDASRQIAIELEQSISIQHSSPIIQPKRQRASSRQPPRQLGGRNTRGSVMSVNESNVSIDEQETMLGGEEDPGNETDASMASQSTVVRGRRGSTMKKAKGGKKAASRNIEEIVHKTETTLAAEVEEKSQEREAAQIDDVSMGEEAFYTPAPEPVEAADKEAASQASKPKVAKGRSRPPKAAPARPAIQQTLTAMEYVVEQVAPIPSKSKGAKAQAAPPPPRSPTPSPKERTPSQSPQSSDAENHPPSSKPAASAKKTATPKSITKRIPLAATTPIISPSKRNIIAGLQSSHPWTAVDLDTIFLKSPNDENAVGLLGDTFNKVQNGDLTSPEKKMTVEEWIHHNAEMAEEKLRNECERMVGTFEEQGTHAMRALEGVECIE